MSKDCFYSPQELIEKFPLTNPQKLFINHSRNEIQKILDGEDNRLIMIVGPCSIHDISAAKEYAEKLQKLSKELADSFLLVMRVYFEKPRTSNGWKGYIYDPHLDGSNSISDGIFNARDLLLYLTDLCIPVATEFLDPFTYRYYADLVSWGCIGARTSSSQTHRQLASALPMPIGFKNNTDGNIEIAINGVISSSHSHTFLGIDSSGKVNMMRSQGNPWGHIVLRGSRNGTNYDSQSIAKALNQLVKAKLPPKLMIDCSHDNSFRQHKQQAFVFQSVIHQIVEGNVNIRGLLIESNLYSGNQPFTQNPNQLEYGVSITDPCLDWESTENLLLWGYQQLKESPKRFEGMPQEWLHNLGGFAP